MPRKRKLTPGRNISRLLVLLCLAFVPVVALGGSPANSAVAGAPTGTASQAQTQSGILVMRVYFRSTAERDQLPLEFDAVENNTTGGFVLIWGNRDDYNTLVARGLRVEIDEETTKEANNPGLFGEASPDTFFGGYRTVEENIAYMQSLATAYPNLAEVVDIGDSWCKTHAGQCTQPDSWNGYDMLVLHITNRSIPGPKPVFWLETAIHSREIAVPEMATRMMAYLLSGYNGLGGYDNDADAHWLVDYHDIWILPHVNPDGHHMVENGASSPRTQRKNADKDDGCTAYPPNDSSQMGTDVNRNFPFDWGCCGGSSTSPCNLTYRGPSAGSEEEGMSIANKIRSLVADQRGPNMGDAAPLNTTGFYQSMHTYAGLNLYPWGFTTADAPNGPDLANIGAHMSAGNASPPGNGYTYGQPPEVLYSVDGDTADWGYGELGIPSYTTELAGSTFFPAYSTIEGLWNGNRGALLYQAKIARTPYLLTRGPDSAAVVTTPMTVTQGTNSQLTGNFNYSWTGNTYSQNITAAEYYLDTPPWAGGVAIPMTPTDGNFNSMTEAAQATINTSSIPVGRHIIFVRGRGTQDYGGFGSWGPVMATWLTVTGGGSPTPTSTGTTLVPSPTNTTVPPTATSTATRTATTAPSPTSGATATCVPVGGTVDVSIEDFAFNSQSVTIGTGTTIRWTNNGSATHTSTSDTALWDSGNLSSGGVFSQTFNTPGVYPYHCDIHPSMVGTITVVAAVPCATNTAPAATSTRTNTTVPATATRTATRTNTAGPPTSTRTGTIVIPSATNTVLVPSATRTSTVAASTPTSPAASPTEGTPGTETATSVPSVTSTVCAIGFTDVPADNAFYTYIRCLACRGIISGYDDGTFRPGNDITRGQIAKIVSNAAGFSDDPGPQVYEDVPVGSPFYDWVNRLSNLGFMGGYQCGLVPEEPCTPPNNYPYFRPNAAASRGQLSKIVSNAAGLSDTPVGQFYTDVEPGHPFYLWIMRLTTLGVMGGYDCGGVGEPCDSENRPYFRPFNNVTRGQASKIVANTFLPGCETPQR